MGSIALGEYGLERECRGVVTGAVPGVIALRVGTVICVIGIGELLAQGLLCCGSHCPGEVIGIVGIA